jgi:SAM-dependent methyltransferase
MKHETIAALNALNRQFYETVAPAFDASRTHPWPGWMTLLPHLEGMAAPTSVLDAGCGNGRFGVFLATHMGALRYHGVDSSRALIMSAKRALAVLQDVEFRLDQRDLLSDPPPGGQFDLVALFGVLHHVASEDNRRALVRALAARVAPGGILVFTCWRFYEYPRFRDRVAAWPEDWDREAGDYLLDWRRGTPALRYCHYVDDAEQDQLAAASGLTRVHDYRADGETGDVNAYTVLMRPPCTSSGEAVQSAADRDAQD